MPKTRPEGDTPGFRFGQADEPSVAGGCREWKTLVALMSMLMALDNGYQACMMAPTEILANQHYDTIRELLYGMDVRVELLTGSIKGKRREAILSGLLTGDVQILIGTHAVIEDTVNLHRWAWS